MLVRERDNRRVLFAGAKSDTSLRQTSGQTHFSSDNFPIIVIRAFSDQFASVAIAEMPSRSRNALLSRRHSMDAYPSLDAGNADLSAVSRQGLAVTNNASFNISAARPRADV